jgi:hypothetical protein
MCAAIFFWLKQCKSTITREGEFKDFFVYNQTNVKGNEAAKKLQQCADTLKTIRDVENCLFDFSSDDVWALFDFALESANLFHQITHVHVS